MAAAFSGYLLSDQRGWASQALITPEILSTSRSHRFSTLVEQEILPEEIAALGE
jgi:hypothetical protein